MSEVSEHSPLTKPNSSPSSIQQKKKEESKEAKKKARQRIAEAIARSQANKNEEQKEQKEKEVKRQAISLRLLWRIMLARARPSLKLSLEKFRQKFWQSIRHDIWNKLAAVMIAIVIWLFIGNPASDVVEATFFVPINATGLSDMTLSRDHPAQVTIQVQGRYDILEALDSSAFHAFVDLHDVEGAYLEPVHITPPTGVRVLQQEPKEVAGTVELLQYRSFPISAIALKQDDGLYTRAFANPNTITALATEQDMARIATVLVLVSNTTERSNEQERLSPQALDSEGKPVADILFSPAQVKVRLQQENTVMTKRIPVRITPLHRSSQLRVAYQHLSANELLLQARYESARANLHALKALDLTVDIAGYEAGLYSIDVPLELPEGVHSMDKTLTLDLELITHNPQDNPLQDNPLQDNPLQDNPLQDNLQETVEEALESEAPLLPANQPINPINNDN